MYLNNELSSKFSYINLVWSYINNVKIYRPEIADMIYLLVAFIFYTLSLQVDCLFLQSPVPGKWILKNANSRNWQVSVKQQGDIEFTEKLLKPDDGSLLTVYGNPIAGLFVLIKLAEKILPSNHTFNHKKLCPVYIQFSSTEIICWFNIPLKYLFYSDNYSKR